MFAEVHLTNTGSHQPELQDQRKRNLVNQRNFRSRRKQYVVELEQKIRAYEQAGVVATKHVQSAARTVAVENTMLRNLVTARLGWSEQELDHYISQAVCHNRTQSPNETRGTRDCCRCQRETQCVGEGREQQPVTFSKLSPLAQTAPDPKGRIKNRLTESTPQLIPSSYIRDDKAQDSAVVPPPCALVARDSRDPKQDLVPQRTTISEAQTYATTLGQISNHGALNAETAPDSFMSCEQAAAVLSELRAQESVELIREELGCASIATCKVTHRDLFQKLDDSV